NRDARFAASRRRYPRTTLAAMQIAVLTSAWNDDGWRERCVAVRRLVGALTSIGEVDVLVPSATSGSAERDGVLNVLRCEGRAIWAADRRTVLESAVGPEDLCWPTACDCWQRLAAALGASVPHVVQRRVATTVGPVSSELISHMRARRYDV